MMMPPHLNSRLFPIIIVVLVVEFMCVAASAGGQQATCFSSIISFGDSLADTGNFLHLSQHNPPYYAFPPYGDNFFRRPTGRVADGRLIVDFIAQHFGLPLLPPYFGLNSTRKEIGEGVNFAFSGATALPSSFLVERGIYNPSSNVTLGTQLSWFKELLAIVCPDECSRCREILQGSLFLVGEIGGIPDFGYAITQGKTKEVIESLVDPVLTSLVAAITELIDLGATTLVVPGTYPLGCVPALLSMFSGIYQEKAEHYDPSTGCITWLNSFSEYYNGRLQRQLQTLQELHHPRATIIYADYYNTAMQFYRSPAQYGFTTNLSACCGGGGPYNYNPSLECGIPPSTSCDDPSSYVFWDGVHFSEAANKFIARGLVEALFAVPHINSMCSSLRYDWRS